MKKIQVLLATYNGSKYVIDQINSILMNFKWVSEYNCSILISDDSSSDETIQLIKNNFSNIPGVNIISTSRKGGVRNNFTFLINYADGDFIFFCDQDDLWLPSKLRVFMDEFNQRSALNNEPMLIHSDLCVTDSILSPIHTSMFEYQKLNKAPSFSNMIVSNSITGCVLGINKRLLNILKKSSINKSIMHDWYIGIIASSFGEIIYIPKSLILYRQHENNQVGAKKFSFYEMLSLEKIQNIKQSIWLTKAQAELFLSDFDGQLDKNNEKILKAYISSFDRNILSRCLTFFKYGFYKYGFARNIVFFIFFVFFAGAIKKQKNIT